MSSIQAFQSAYQSFLAQVDQREHIEKVSSSLSQLAQSKEAESKRQAIATIQMKWKRICHQYATNCPNVEKLRKRLLDIERRSKELTQQTDCHFPPAKAIAYLLQDETIRAQVMATLSKEAKTHLINNLSSIHCVKGLFRRIFDGQYGWQAIDKFLDPTKGVLIAQERLFRALFVDLVVHGENPKHAVDWFHALTEEKVALLSKNILATISSMKDTVFSESEIHYLLMKGHAEEIPETLRSELSQLISCVRLPNHSYNIAVEAMSPFVYPSNVMLRTVAQKIVRKDPERALSILLLIEAPEHEVVDHFATLFKDLNTTDDQDLQCALSLLTLLETQNQKLFIECTLSFCINTNICRFGEMLSLLEHIKKDSRCTNVLSDLAYRVMRKYPWDGNEKVRTFFYDVIRQVSKQEAVAIIERVITDPLARPTNYLDFLNEPVIKDEPLLVQAVYRALLFAQVKKFPLKFDDFTQLYAKLSQKNKNLMLERITRFILQKHTVEDLRNFTKVLQIDDRDCVYRTASLISANKETALSLAQEISDFEVQRVTVQEINDADNSSVTRWTIGPPSMPSRIDSLLRRSWLYNQSAMEEVP